MQAGISLMHAKLCCRKYKLVQTSDHWISTIVFGANRANGANGANGAHRANGANFDKRSTKGAQCLLECLGANMQAGISLMQSCVESTS